MSGNAARAGGATRRILTLLVVAAAVVLGALAMIDIRRLRPEATASGAAPTPEPRAATPAARRLPAGASPTPAATPTATPSFETSSVTLSWRPEPTATATAVATAPPRRQPTATPAIPQCVAIAWASRQGTLTQVLVDIEAENRCGRDLEPLDVWFEVSGFRQGDLIQSARGHLFDRLYRGAIGRATIALPGSADWMETIQVVVLDPAKMY